MNSKSNKLPACIYWFAQVLVFAVFLSSPSYAVNVTFGWDPNDEPDLEGYKVYRNIGSPGPPYKYRTTLQEKKLADPLNPMVTLTGLKENTNYYVALTAYDNDGNESSYSDDVCVQIVDSAIEACSSSTNGITGNSGSDDGGSGGGVCFISSAGPEAVCLMDGLFFEHKPVKIFFALLFLLLFGAARSQKIGLRTEC